MTKTDLITGILGSGKTTFIKKYAEYLLSQGMKIAILENDFGAVNVDMMMLQDLKSERCQIEMVSGGCDSDCHKRRFKTQLIALGMQKFDRVIIEPSGIFDIDEFFDTMHESPLDRWFEIGSVFAVVDAETDDNLSEYMEYLLASEVSCCGKIILSKADMISDIEKAKDNVLSHINRSLDFVKCSRRFSKDDVFAVDYNKITDDDFAFLSRSGYRYSGYVKKYTIEDIKSSVHYFMHIRIPENKIADVIGNIMNDAECGEIYRLKGSLPYGDKWLRVNVTKEKTEFSETESGQPVIIAIGDDINKEKIDSYFLEFNNDSEYVSI